MTVKNVLKMFIVNISLLIYIKLVDSAKYIECVQNI